VKYLKRSSSSSSSNRSRLPCPSQLISTTPRPQRVALGKRAYGVAVRIWTLIVGLVGVRVYNLGAILRSLRRAIQVVCLAVGSFTAYISTVAVAPCTAAGTDENCGSSTVYQSDHATTTAPSAAASHAL